ncbi:MAG: hypothetical protein JOZ73_12865 [Solirubrobacterales bacterium]|nr:hypothetical protein [Solirubrobacterales bacterium]
MYTTDKLPAVDRDRREASSDPPSGRQSEGEAPKRAVPLLWRVFAANAAVFAVAVALLALTPVTVHASIRLSELVVLLAGLVVMLIVDLLLLRHVLAPMHRLSRCIGTIDHINPGQRAHGFDRASSETQALAQAFNQMLDRLEDERRESSARALAAQERERLRIARELHDEIGQTLTAVALRAEHASSNSDSDAGELAQLAEIVQHTLQDLRRISRELRPETLDELGLVNALISLCERVGQRKGLHVRRQLNVTLPPMPPEAELAIYRIVQEALTNVIRHSNASRATVALTRSGNELVLSISDNGHGLPVPLEEGGGLTGMRERALTIRGELQIEPTPGGGVTVTVRLPVDQDGGEHGHAA